MAEKTVRHYHHHYRFSYTTSFRRHFTSVIVVLVVLVGTLMLFFRAITPQNGIQLSEISLLNVLTAAVNTLTRLCIAYFFAIIISIPLALIITGNQKLEKVLLPVFDIIQSIPVLAFFPVIVVTFIKFNFLEGAAIFIITFTMIGNLVFSMIGGLKTIPEDITNSAIVFGARGFSKLFNITIPSIFPYLLTGSLLAWAQAWSIIIVAEALHTYIPNGSPSNDLYGLGSLMVDAFSQGKNSLFLIALVVMIIIITLLNYFVWQKLLHLAERFRFD